ncbi:uncharacterized protein LY79DRAFT_668459 [Colletotrichum navitas]|uniref:Uncharacterized protein n=1 Tax=Colletotrichum navitas TaxID=681940 RepID=A0AAD8V740_9PEZI|nr:uncharacterized protein LY79DRAFT_668459 [Colletotrichum navitas]KAK1594858.1 hypothetical protein LY79DRAFT_668459 [Colletotrichum navitas]
MMPTLMGGVLPGPVPTAYQTDALFDDLSRQMAISQASRRLSRGSNGQRNGNAMRVAKPTSANNSPRSSSAMQARRRTVVNDGNLARRRQQPIDQVTMPEYGSQSRPSRPLSWHPSTFQHQQHKMPAAQYMASYPFPPASSAYDTDSYNIYSQFPPTPAAYSSAAYLPVEGWNVPQQDPPAYVSSEAAGYAEPFPALPTTLPDLTPSSTSTHWHSYPMDGFPSTSPPTPETLPQAQQPQPIVPNEDTIPYQPLDEPEEEGEILVGMGLYDAPDKYEQDPQLDASRSAMSSLLGAPYRPQEGTGKGLKLEESWQPPDSDDEDADQDDADGEDSD